MTDEYKVLERLQKSGTFDELRRNMAGQLRTDPNLQASARRRVEEELRRTDDRKSRKQIFEGLCRMLEESLVADAMQQADRVLFSSSHELSKSLDEHVEQALVGLQEPAE